MLTNEIDCNNAPSLKPCNNKVPSKNRVDMDENDAIKIANKIYYSNDISILPSFSQQIFSYYLTKMFQDLNFTNKEEAANVSYFSFLKLFFWLR